MSSADSKTRDRSIFLAVLTSLASKVGTLLLRFISIPIAIHTLSGGLEEFGVYIAITVVVAMVDIFQVGLGPALTHRLSKAVTRGDRQSQQQIVGTAMLLSTSVVLICAAILSLILANVPITTLFGEKFAPHAAMMKPACWVAILIISIEVICILIDRARDGYMETRINNLWGAGGNVVGAGLLFFGIASFPNIIFLLLAVNGSIAAAKLGNTIHFFIQRPFLLHWFRSFRKSLVKPLIISGGLFTITYSLSALIEYSLLGYFAGRYLGPEAAATCGIFVTIHVSLMGMIQMFTIPAWPALIDARGRGDILWIRKTGNRLRLLSLAFGLAVILGISLLGPWAIPLWVGEPLVVGRTGMTLFAVFFAVGIWRHANQILLLGFDQEKWVARVIIVEALASLAILWGLMHSQFQLEFVYAGVAVVVALVTGWVFPLKFRRLIRENNDGDIPVGFHESTGLDRQTNPV